MKKNLVTIKEIISWIAQIIVVLTLVWCLFVGMFETFSSTGWFTGLFLLCVGIWISTYSSTSK